MQQDTHWFKKATCFAQRHFSFLTSNTDGMKSHSSFFTKDYTDSLRFSGFNITTSEIITLSYMIAFLCFIIMIIFDSCILILYYISQINLDLFTIVLLLISTCLLPFIFMNLFATYPKVYIQYKKIHSLGDIPEILSYLVMYLKMVPNLENGIRFTAKESHSSLAFDLQKMLWDMEIRVYHGINDGLTSFANHWGSWSDHFKRALHLIRSSIDESNESQRIMTLNKALDVGLEGTRDVMQDYAEKLHQPTLVIYSIGIMIPLAIIAMLPAAGLIGLQITIIQMFLVYDILLPLILFLYIRKILLLRPATFNPPKIPNHHPDLCNLKGKKHAGIAIFLGITVSIPGWISIFAPHLIQNGINHTYVISSFLYQFHELIPLSIFIFWGFSISVAYYVHMIYRPVKKIRDRIKHMEMEFSDSLYIIGKRISEDKSPEESFHYTADLMRGSTISHLYFQTAYNLSAMQTTIQEALFNQEYGSLCHIYSDRIHSILRLFVEGIKKSQHSASISIIKLADHLKDLQLVEKKIKESLSQLTSTLNATASFFAPMIAGVTLAITQLITTIIEKMISSIDTSSFYAQSTIVEGIGNVFSLENIDPNFFVLIIGIYLIELVFLLVRFTNGIENGDDTAEFYHSLGAVLPISVLILTISLFFSQLFLSNITLHL